MPSTGALAVAGAIAMPMRLVAAVAGSRRAADGAIRKRGRARPYAPSLRCRGRTGVRPWMTCAVPMLAFSDVATSAAGGSAQ